VFHDRAQDQAADATETVDGDADRHEQVSTNCAQPDAER